MRRFSKHFILSLIILAVLAGGLFWHYKTVWAVPPATPINMLVTTPAGHNQLVVTFTDNSTNEDRWYMERATAPAGPWTSVCSNMLTNHPTVGTCHGEAGNLDTYSCSTTKLGTVGGCTFTDNNLVTGTHYYYQVKAGTGVTVATYRPTVTSIPAYEGGYARNTTAWPVWAFSSTLVNEFHTVPINDYSRVQTDDASTTDTLADCSSGSGNFYCLAQHNFKFPVALAPASIAMMSFTYGGYWTAGPLVQPGVKESNAQIYTDSGSSALLTLYPSEDLTATLDIDTPSGTAAQYLDASNNAYIRAYIRNIDADPNTIFSISSDIAMMEVTSNPTEVSGYATADGYPNSVARSNYSDIVDGFTLAAAVTTAPTVDSPRWDTLRVSTMPSNGSNPAYTEYCLGTYFSYWPTIAPIPDTRYTTDISMLYVASILALPETASPPDVVDDDSSDPAHVKPKCYIPASWTLPRRIEGASAVPMSPNSPYQVGSYSQSGDGSSSSSNVVTPPTAVTERYTRALNPSMPQVTATGSSSVHITMDRVPPPLSHPMSWVCGDIQGDTLINGNDVVWLVDVLNNAQVMQDEWVADVNGDRVVNAHDVYYLVQRLQGGPDLNCGGNAYYTLNPGWTDYAVEANTNIYVNPSTGVLVSGESWWDYDGSCSLDPSQNCHGTGTPCSPGAGTCVDNGSNWAGSTGKNVTGLSTNTCYNFRAKSRNEGNCSVSNVRCSSDTDCTSPQTCLRYSGEKPGKCTNGTTDCFSNTDCTSPQTCSFTPWSAGKCSITTTRSCYKGSDCPAGESCNLTSRVCTLAATPALNNFACNSYTTANGYNCQAGLGINGNPPVTTYKMQVSTNGGLIWGDMKVCSLPSKVDGFYYSCQSFDGSDCPASMIGTPSCNTWNNHANNNDTLIFRSLACNVLNSTYYFRAIARNQQNQENPSLPVSDTLPPCQPTAFSHSDNTYDTILRLYPIVWTWAAPAGGSAVDHYDYFDLADKCVAGWGTDTLCTNPAENVLNNRTTYTQIQDASKIPTSPNTSYGGYVRAVDNRKRGSQPSGTSSAFTAIQSPTGVSLKNIQTTSIDVEAVPSDPASYTDLTNLNPGHNAGIQFRETPPGHHNGVNDAGFYYSSADHFVHTTAATDSGLWPNRHYCYQTQSRNSDGLPAGPGDYRSWQPGGALCTYTLAQVPDAPKLVRQPADTTVRANIQTTELNPHGPVTGELDAPDTEYALCVTKLDDNGNPVYGHYVDPSTGTIDHNCIDPTCDTEATCIGSNTGIGECNSSWNPNIASCVSGDGSGHWATYSNGPANWGSRDGVLVNLVTAGKYELMLKARNAASTETNFGRPATLFLVKNNVVGWAWSSNIGWISLNCLNLYERIGFGYSCNSASDWGVNTDFEASRPINPLEGYAWAGSGQALGETWTAENVSRTATGNSRFNSNKPKADRTLAVGTDGTVHVAWTDNATGLYKVYYLKWNGTVWVDINGNTSRADIIIGNADVDTAVSLVLDADNQPHVAYTDGGIVYKYWDTAQSRWEAADGTTTIIAIPGSAGALHPSLRLSPVDRRPRIVWQKPHDAISDVMYTEWSGTDWVRAGQAAAPSSPADNCPSANGYCFDGLNNEAYGIASLAVDGQGRPAIAWTDNNPADRVSYQYWNGSSWVSFASTNTLFSNTACKFPSLQLDTTGNPYLAMECVTTPAGTSLPPYYIKGDKGTGVWSDMDGHSCPSANCTAHAPVGTDTGDNVSLAMDSNSRPHLVFHHLNDLYYRWWNDTAWVTASGDATSGLNAENVNITNSSKTDSFAPSLVLDQSSRPHVVWQEHMDAINNTAPDDIFYSGWQESATRAGLGWLSFNLKVCDNNAQRSCAQNSDCAGGGQCTSESAGALPDGSAGYGFCYNATPERYGTCSNNGNQCTQGNESDPSQCGTSGLCVFETCSIDGNCTGGGVCHQITTASFNGETREVEGWARVLSLKAEGEKHDCDPNTPGVQPCADWGWINLKGTYDDGHGKSGPYGVIGTEVDSQQFLGDPDVVPTQVNLYTLFGWGWNSQRSDFGATSSWPPGINVSGTKEVIKEGDEPSMAIDSHDNPHIAWANVSGVQQDIYYVERHNGQWVTATGDIYQPGSTPSVNITNTLNGSSLYPSLAIGTDDIPRIAWTEEGSAYYLQWSTTRNQWETITGAAFAVANVDDGSRVSSRLRIDTGAEYPSLRLDSTNNPNIAYIKTISGNDHQIYFMKWDSSAGNWTDVDGGAADKLNISNAGVDNCTTSPQLALGTDGRPHIVWKQIIGAGGGCWDGGEIHYRRWNGSAWETASGNITPGLGPPRPAGLHVNFDVVNFLENGDPPNNNHGEDPSLALDSNNQPGIVWRDPNDVYYRYWNGTAWMPLSDALPPPTSLFSNMWVNMDTLSGTFPPRGERTGSAGDSGALSVQMKNNQPYVAWAENLSGKMKDVHLRMWNGSHWVTISGDGNDANPHIDDVNFNVSNNPRFTSINPVMAFDRWGNAHVAWIEAVHDYNDADCQGNSEGGQTCCATDADCTNSNYPQCYNMYPNYFCSAIDVNYTRWSPGVAQSGFGWVEFIPANALLGIPYLQTRYSDIYAGSSIQLAPPPRGSGNFTATYLILANGSIQGVQGYYSGTLTGQPTSSFTGQGLEPIIPTANQSYGTDALSKIDVNTLIAFKDNCFNGHGASGSSIPCDSTSPEPVRGNNKYGQTVEKYVGDNLNLSDGSILGIQPLLNGRIYYFTPTVVNDPARNNYTINEEMMFMKGTNPVSTGNGLIIVNGNLEVNKDVYYHGRCTNPADANDQDTAGSCHFDYECTTGSRTVCRSVKLDNVSEMPSAAFIIRGDAYINSFVHDLAGVWVALDPNPGDAVEQGFINTGRKMPAAFSVNANDNDEFVGYDKPNDRYSSGVDLNEYDNKVGYHGTQSLSYRDLMRWQINVPAGADIKKATLRLYGTSSSVISADFSAKVQLIDSASPDINTNDYRVCQTASGGDPRSCYTIGTSNGMSYQLTTTGWQTAGWHDIDVKSLVQHFLNSDAYADGTVSTIGLIMKEGDAEKRSNGADNFVTFESYNTNPILAPQLVIEYAPQRTVYTVAAGADDAVATSPSAWDNTSACMNVGWDGAASRVFLRFSPPTDPQYRPLPLGAEITQAQLKVKSNACSMGGVAFDGRQGLLDFPDMPTFGTYVPPGTTCTPPNCSPYNTFLDQNVSELAGEIASGAWSVGSTYTFPNIVRLVQEWVNKTSYMPANHLGLRLRRGTDETQITPNAYRALAGGESKLIIDYQLPLHVAGLFIAHGYKFDRTYTKSLEAAEQIVYDGRVVANPPPGLSDFTQSLPVYQKVTP